MQTNLIKFNTYKLERGGLLVPMYDQFNARVGDQGTPLVIQWTQGTTDTPVDLQKNKLHFYATGQVGKYLEKLDDGTGYKMSADASSVEYDDKDSAGTQANGITVAKLPKQFFPQEGIFYGYFGLKDDTGNVYSSINVWFRVLGGVPIMGAAIPYFSTRFDELMETCQGRIEDVLAQLRQEYQDEVKKNEDMSAETRAALSKLADAVGAIQAQIDAGDVVTLKKHEDDYDSLRRDQAALSNQITDKLSKISMVAQTFVNLAALKAAYPDGTDGVCVTLDDKHGHVWSDGAWQDTGVFISGGLDNATKDKIANSVTGLTNIYQLAQLVPPYDDIRTIPVNSVVTYSVDVTKIKHVPENISTFTAMRIGFSTGNPSGSVTMLLDDKGHLYTSYTYGDTDNYKYTPWVASKSNRNNRNIYQSNQVVAPYDDLYTIPANSTVLYSVDVSKIKHIPETDQLGLGSILVQTTSYDDDNLSGGRIDVTEIATGRQWHCRVTGNPGAYYYSRWTYVESEAKNRNIYQLGQLVAPYDDLNTLPSDSKVLYSVDVTKIKNFPLEYNFGTAFVQTQSFAENTKSGARQIITNYDGREAVRFITGVEGHYSFTPWKLYAFENIQSYLEPSLSMFEHFAVIGDSYGSGTLFFDDKWGGNDNLQWGLMLAKKYGTTYTRMAIGGISTRTWLTDEQGLKKLNSSDPQDIYYLCLGINDEAILEKNADYLGSVADIDNGSDTFYGNYGRIIKAIQAKAPKARIIMFGLSQTTALYPQITKAIKGIAEYVHVPYQPLDDPLFTSSYYLNQSGGHPVGPVYGAMAEAYARLIKKCVITNQDYFRRYGWQD